MRSDRISSTKAEISKQFSVEKPANTGKAKLQTVQIIKIKRFMLYRLHAFA